MCTPGSICENFTCHCSIIVSSVLLLHSGSTYYTPFRITNTNGFYLVLSKVNTIHQVEHTFLQLINISLKLKKSVNEMSISKISKSISSFLDLKEANILILFISQLFTYSNDFMNVFIQNSGILDFNSSSMCFSTNLV